MARGAISKSEVSKKILSSFEGAFLYNDGKEIRIPMQEEGEVIQIKVALTAAKENVNPGDDNAIPGMTATETDFNINSNETTSRNIQLQSNEHNITIEPTKEEKQNVSDLLRALGL